jgi:hypothetical protein
MKTSLLISALVVLAVAAPAAAAEKTPPLPGGVTCKQHVKPTYDLSAISKRGLTVDVTCTGAARFFVQPELDMRSRAYKETATMFPNQGWYPPIVTVPKGRLDRAGTQTLRFKLVPWVKRLLRRFPRTKLTFTLGARRVDGTWRSGPGWTTTAVVVR